jgi:glycine hydroxymethyltransferase
MTNASWNSLFTTPLSDADPEIARLIERQRRQNTESVNLVASESYCPRATLEAEASILINKNASGYPPRVSFAGGEVMDAIELLAVERAKRLFGAEHANIQSLSSTISNVAALRALLEPGDRILAFDRTAGGHSSHGSSKHVSGQDYVVESFGLDPETGLIDYAAAHAHARAFRPRMIVAGSSAYPRRIDFQKLHQIAQDVGAMLFADIAHVSGLIVAGLHPNPTPLSDVVTTSTHKTFCGPRTGGLILCRARYARAIDEAVAPGVQAAPGGHIIAARAVLFDRVQRPEFRELMRAVVDGAAALARGIAAEGIELFAGGTETHMVVIDLRNGDWQEAALNAHLERHGIIGNTTTLPKRTGDASALGFRIGSTPMSIRGLDVQGFEALGRTVGQLLKRGSTVDAEIQRSMKALALSNPIPFG